MVLSVKWFKIGLNGVNRINVGRCYNFLLKFGLMRKIATCWCSSQAGSCTSYEALKYFFFADYSEHAIPLFLDAQVLPIKFLYYESIANLMFDVRNTSAPSNIQDLFQDISHVHSYNTRSSTSNNFYTKPSRLSVLANSFSRIGVKVWNEIPQALRDLSKNAFKRKLKQILFNILGSQDSYIDLSQIIKNVKSW